MSETDGAQGELPGFWLSVSELAKLRGVSKQAVSRRAERLQAQGLLSRRDGPRGTVLINVAEFDRATGEATDIVRATNGASNRDRARGAPYSQEQARRAGYDADLKKLELDERLGKLVSVDEVVAAVTRVADAMVTVIDKLPSRAEDMANAVTASGIQGARAALKAAAHDWRVALADSLDAVLASEKKTSAED
jgi:DNA-binding MarR family transcriptional regulator